MSNYSTTEQELKKRSARFLQGVDALAAATRPNEACQAGPSPEGREAPTGERRRPSSSASSCSTKASLPPGAIALLAKVALEPETLLVSLYETLGLHPVKGKRLVTELEARGMVRPHRLPRSGRGGQPTVLEVLDPGVVELRKRDIEPAAKLIGRGGFLHDLYGRWFKRWAIERSYKCEFEKTLGQKNFDVVLRTPSGEIIGIEICLSGSLKHNAIQLLKAASVEGVSQVIVVSDDREWLSRMRKRLSNNHEASRKISYGHVAEFAPDLGRTPP